MKLNLLDQHRFRKLARKAATQGPTHKADLTNLYLMINEAAEDSFKEDNYPTLSTYLAECHNNASKIVLARLNLQYAIKEVKEKK